MMVGGGGIGVWMGVGGVEVVSRALVTVRLYGTKDQRNNSHGLPFICCSKTKGQLPTQHDLRGACFSRDGFN